MVKKIPGIALMTLYELIVLYGCYKIIHTQPFFAWGLVYIGFGAVTLICFGLLVFAIACNVR